MTPPSPGGPAASPIREAIVRHGGPISFAEFMRLALYHPETGYYRQKRERVGFGGSSDFYTAASTGAVFGELLLEAARTMLSPAEPADFSFVEIGAEPGAGIVPAAHIFGESRVLRLGDPIEIPPAAVVFSNELFDAQPFHRLVFRAGTWREIGVRWTDGPEEVLLPDLSPEVRGASALLPPTAGEGWHLDLPLASVSLLTDIAATGWRGLFIAFDYGKSWRELTRETPQGTARAYRRHRQSPDLLSDPGDQDLTCHVCWDWLTDSLEREGFRDVKVESQEAFFVRHAAAQIERVITAQPGQFDPRRQTLQQLLYPGHMGQRFQVLTAKR